MSYISGARLVDDKQVKIASTKIYGTCRLLLLLGNIGKRELTITQRHLLGKLRSTKRSTKKRIYPRENRNSYIKLQTTRKLPLFYGNLLITKMRRKLTSYIPFLLNPETRLDVLLVRLHFCETLPQSRPPLSFRKVCANSGIVNITHFKVSHGDIISFKENDAFTRKKEEEIRRFFYIKILVAKIIGKFRFGLLKKEKEWFRLLKKTNPRALSWGIMVGILFLLTPFSCCFCADLQLELSLAPPGEEPFAEGTSELGQSSSPVDRDSDTTRMDELREALFYASHWDINGERTSETVDAMVSTQLKIEKAVEGALRERGFSAESLLAKRRDIREILFDAHRDNKPFKLLLDEIQENGINGSRALKKVLTATQNLDLLIEREP